MTTLFLLYTLKPETTAAAYEDWVRNRDYPAMRGLKRVSSFVTHRTTGLLMGEGRPSADYIEVFEIDDFAGFTAEDLPGALVQGVMGEFMGKVQGAEFVVAEPVN